MSLVRGNTYVPASTFMDFCRHQQCYRTPFTARSAEEVVAQMNRATQDVMAPENCKK